MGTKKVTVRTLPTGEKVYDHPPTEAFPGGRQVLVPTTVVADQLAARDEEFADAEAVRAEGFRQAIAAKRASLAAHPAVPRDKSPI